ncbi:hypothetical protein P154DRAFT_519551 [Amniculicola lignicola CBS 123094]|uniref:C6 transcription factor n=1 Tax=Amniculicola lignicola CBS 123094 TaxID=1392246 RepID=A0A6A5WXY3_9PLEO|nr:hypothetical protein P154DRAFT_519551 [Amniculicola lignicola CBS 123094]
MTTTFLDLLPSNRSTSMFLPPSKIPDVALMHHWCTRTCYSFTVHEVELFRDHVGQEALCHEYLMDALLATTLLHIASESTDYIKIRSLVDEALHRQNNSVSGLRAALSELSPQNCDSVFACSVLLMVCSIVSPLLSRRCDDQVRYTADAILLLADFIRGISSVVHLGRPWLEQGRLHQMFDHKCKHFFAATKRDFPVDELRWLRDNNTEASSLKREVFNHALQELESAFNGEQSTVKWIVRVGDRFVDELRKGNAVAIIILMFWGVLLHGLDKTWWTQYSGRRLVEDLSASSDGQAPEWVRLAVWCQEQVGLSL